MSGRHEAQHLALNGAQKTGANIIINTDKDDDDDICHSRGAKGC